ncbi:MAG: hypothetical protein Q9217_001015 [Psora testacea]
MSEQEEWMLTSGSIVNSQPDKPYNEPYCSNRYYDVIQRLAPSLAQYQGGTIIDVNPGAGLFSSKIHEHLKPRNHVLIEADHKNYAHFLDPLLCAPGSRYHLRDWRDERIWVPQEYTKEGLIPERTSEANNATLQIVNATNRKIQTINDNILRVADARALAFAQNARQGTGFHAGPTRMLMWCDDADKKSFVPRSVEYRRKIAVFLEAHCHVEEVVGFGGPVKGARREESIELASSKRVRQRMKELRISPIAGREVASPDSAGELSDVSRHWHEEMRDLKEKLESGEVSQYIDYPPGPLEKSRTGRRTDGKEYTPEFQRYDYLRQILKGQNDALGHAQELAAQQVEIDALDLRTYDPDLSDEQRKELLLEYDVRNEALKAKVSSLTLNKRKQFLFLVDDRHAFHMNPPLLSWDNRTYEPLTASTSEFLNPKQLALLDFQARPPDTFPLTNDQAIFMDLLGTALFWQKGPHTLGILKKVAPGAYEALVPKVEEIRDARQGGRRDVDGVRVRTMTPRMLWRLAVEWGEWPFKPEMRELLRGPTGNDFQFSRRVGRFG